MKLSAIQEELVAFLKEKNWLDLDPRDVFIHLVEEIGEIGKTLLFMSNYKTEAEGHVKPSHDELKTEFIHAFSLFLHLAIRLNVNLEESWPKEFKKLRKRFTKID